MKTFAYVKRAGTIVALLLPVAIGPLAARAADPYDINVILPLTGAQTFVGKGSRDGLEGVEQLVNKQGGINGRPVHFVFEDDQSNAQTTVELASALIAKKVPIIMGTASAAGCGATVPLVKDGPLLYCLSPGLHPADGSFAFSASVSSADLARATISYLRLRGLHRIAVITSTDASGQDGERGIDAALASPDGKDVTVVEREHFAPNDVSVEAQMARIKAAGPQAVVAWTTGTPLATVLRDVTGIGLGVPIVTTPANATFAQMHQYAQFMPKELLFPNKIAFALNQVSDAGVRDVLRTFFATMHAMGVTPDVVPSTTWDPGMIVVEALRKLGTGATPAQLRDFIAHLRGFAGVTGRYDFVAIPQRGVGVESVVMTRWDPVKDTWVGVSRPGGAPAP